MWSESFDSRSPGLEISYMKIIMRFTDKLNYLLLCAVLYPLSWLPLRMLYPIGDLFAWLAHSIVGYRRKVVRENLKNSFPEMSEKERRVIEKKYYHFLGDYAMETIKLLTMSERQMRRRLVVENPEVIANALSEGRNVTLFLGHYCNWEWVSSLPIYFPKNAECAQIYHPLHNKGMDKMFIKIRTRFGANNIAMEDILRKLIGWKRAGIPTVTGYIADQTPGYNFHLFVDFLHQDTGVFTGPERISDFLDAEVWFCHMSRPKRGEYHLTFKPVTMHPKHEETFAITRKCFELLESNILEAPQYWLWSHRRWKRNRKKFMKYWGDKAQEQLSHL